MLAFSLPAMVKPEILLDDRYLFHINNLEEVLLAVVNELYDAYTNIVAACAGSQIQI